MVHEGVSNEQIQGSLTGPQGSHGSGCMPATSQHAAASKPALQEQPWAKQSISMSRGTNSRHACESPGVHSPPPTDTCRAAPLRAAAPTHWNILLNRRMRPSSPWCRWTHLVTLRQVTRSYLPRGVGSASHSACLKVTLPSPLWRRCRSVRLGWRWPRLLQARRGRGQGQAQEAQTADQSAQNGAGPRLLQGVQGHAQGPHRVDLRRCNAPFQQRWPCDHYSCQQLHHTDRQRTATWMHEAALHPATILRHLPAAGNNVHHSCWHDMGWAWCILRFSCSPSCTHTPHHIGSRHSARVKTPRIGSVSALQPLQGRHTRWLTSRPVRQQHEPAWELLQGTHQRRGGYIRGHTTHPPPRPPAPPHHSPRMDGLPQLF
jgi:hypothetical protein